MQRGPDETASAWRDRVVAEQKYFLDKYGDANIAFGVGAEGIGPSPYPLVPPANVLTDGVMTPAPNVAATLIDPETEMPSLAAILADDATIVTHALADEPHAENWRMTVGWERDGSSPLIKHFGSREAAYAEAASLASTGYTYLSIRRV